MSENKGNFLLFAADYLIQQSCGGTLRFPCSVSVDIHCGTDIGVSEKFLHIFRFCAAGKQIACVGVAERVEMEILKPFHFFLCRPAHNPYRTRRFIRPVCSQADKGEFLVIFRDFLCPLQAVNLIIGAPFFLYFFVVVQVIKLPVAETVFALFGSRRPQDCRQRVAEINGADFAPLCRSYFGCVPCSVIAHTAAYCKILFFKVNILPSQAAYFPDTKPRVVRYLHRQQGGIVFCLEKFLQLLELLMGDSRNTGSIFLTVRENIRFLLPAPQLHILHRVKGNQFFRENRKAEGILQHRREQEHTEFINRYISDPEQHLKVFDKNSVYLPTKKIGKNNPKEDEIKADNAARQEWNRTADMALLSGISEAKILEVKRTEIHEKASQSIKSKGWLPGLFRSIVNKAKDFLRNLIREHAMPPKPVLEIDMAEFRTMQKLMIKAQDKAKEIRHLQDTVLPKLKQQLADTKGIFKGKERKALTEQIQRTEKEIAEKLDKLPDVLKEDGYPDVQAFMATYRKAEAVVEQYNRDLAAWERQVREKQKPAQKEQAKPPERESVLKRLRQLQAEGKQRNQPRQRKKSFDRDSR